MSELSRKRRVRGGHRTSVKRLLNSVDEIDYVNVMEEEETNQFERKLTQTKAALTDKLKVLDTMNDSILELVEEDKIDEEIEECDIFNEKIRLKLLEIDSTLSRISDSRIDKPTMVSSTRIEVDPQTPAQQIHTQATHTQATQPEPLIQIQPTQSQPTQPQQSESSLSQASSVHFDSRSYLKLPKLDLKKFSGDLSAWPTFWDSFEVAIHKNPNLDRIDKFNYLNTLVEKSAADAIAGLSLTSSNYEEAIEILKRRFGNKQLIINQHMEALLNIESTNQNLKALRTLYDTVESKVRALRSLGVPSESYGSLLSSILMNKLPPDLRLIVSREVQGDDWKLDRVLDILLKELEARERAFTSRQSRSNESVQEKLVSKIDNYIPKRRLGSATSLLVRNPNQQNFNQISCTYCRSNHTSNSCQVVTNISARKELLSRYGRCYVCLKKGHIGRNCPDGKKCPCCDGFHHISICSRREYNQSQNPRNGNNHMPSMTSVKSNFSSSQFIPKPASSQATTSHSSVAMYIGSSTPVLLQTAQVVIHGSANPNFKGNFRLIFDSGSQRSYVTIKVKNTLNLPSTRRQSVSINTFGSKSEVPMVVDVVNFFVETETGTVQVSAFVVPHICDPVHGQPILEVKGKYPHLAHLKLADYTSDDNELEIDILIGSDQQWNFFTGRVLRGESGPTAIQTNLGWVLSGPVYGLKTKDTQHSMISLNQITSLFVNELSLDDSLKRFWDLESMGIQPKSIYDDLVENIVFKNNQYEVQLPWRIPHSILPDNYDLCTRRLTNLMKRLRMHPEIFKEYDAVIKDQLERGIIEEVKEPAMGEVGNVHYLPHHPVIRRDKSTTKVRIVYDASARSSGPSLNDCLYAGPPLTEHIFNILLRFRIHRIAVVGDIEKAFLMVAMNEKDRDVLRFLWMNDIQDDQSLIVLRFTRVVFGVSSSPFLLNATIKQHIEQYIKEDPDFVRCFLRSIYVDDLSSGADDENSAYEFYQKSKSRLAEGGFNLRKFMSNSKYLLEKIQSEESSNEVKSGQVTLNDVNSDEIKISKIKSAVIEDDDSFSKAEFGNNSTNQHKILGVTWNPVEDSLVFDIRSISEFARNIHPTKRHVVSVSSRFYDPLGLLSPFIVQFKILFQDLCKLGIDWDEPLDGELRFRFDTLVDVMSKTEVFSLSRCYFNDIQDQIISCDLHGFCDASMKAYGAVIYLQIRTTTSTIVRFIASKTRVAPVVQHSIPRLELLSALVLSRLIVTIQDAFQTELEIGNTVCWTDSKVALFWIKNQTKEWKQFIQNRVNEIRTLLPVSCWNHCPGISNPADIPSRGMNPNEFLRETVIWLQGPDWLKGYQFNSEVNQENNEEYIPENCKVELKIGELRNSNQSTVSVLLLPTRNGNLNEIINCNNFSDLNRLLRVTSYVMKFVKIIQTNKSNIESYDRCLSVEDIQKAENLWIKEVQVLLTTRDNFELLKNQYDLFEDKDGILRALGRLQNSELPYSSRFPVLLDTNHWFTTLIVQDSHRKVMHGGVNTTLTDVRSRFWLIKGRQFVRKIIFNCTICRRFDAKPYLAPSTPPLPDFRIKEAPAFSYTGLDYIGPVFIKQRDGILSKIWICLYTCCVSRAVHLEMVQDLTPESFLRSFRRFTARKNTPMIVVSDNASTFKPVTRELDIILNSKHVKNSFLKTRITWTYNLAKAPWWGGFYERLVKSVKQCLKKTLGQATLTYDEMLTSVVEIEMILNSRPLSYVSTEDIEEPLTPSHLLCGRKISGLPENVISNDLDIDVSTSDLTRRMKHINSVLNHFWRRWRNEYLLELRNCHKNLKRPTGTQIISINDVVLIHDEHHHRGFWRLGVVESFITGKDGEVRGASVKIKTKSGKNLVIQRPVQLLYPLETSISSKNSKVVENKDYKSKDFDPVVITPDVSPNVRERRTAAVEGEKLRRKWIEDLRS